MRRPLFSSAAARGFSLVEVTVAIGILGLLPAALKLRAESAQEMRAAVIAQEMFAAIASAPDLKNISIRQGPGLSDVEEYKTGGKLIDLSVDGNGHLFGYPSQTTIPTSRYRTDPDGKWTNGTTEGYGTSVTTLARLSSSSAGANLRRVTVEVRSPATLPLKASRPTTFSTLVYSP